MGATQTRGHWHGEGGGGRGRWFYLNQNKGRLVPVHGIMGGWLCSPMPRRRKGMMLWGGLAVLTYAQEEEGYMMLWEGVAGCAHLCLGGGRVWCCGGARMPAPAGSSCRRRKRWPCPRCPGPSGTGNPEKQEHLNSVLRSRWSRHYFEDPEPKLSV